MSFCKELIILLCCQSSISVCLTGGTIDVTVHQVTQLGGLREVFFASGGGWGSTLVNKAFENFLKDIVDGAVLDRYIREEPEDWIDLCRDFEMRKRNFQREATRQITMRLPLSLVKIMKVLELGHLVNFRFKKKK